MNEVQLAEWVDYVVARTKIVFGKLDQTCRVEWSMNPVGATELDRQLAEIECSRRLRGCQVVISFEPVGGAYVDPTRPVDEELVLIEGPG